MNVTVSLISHGHGNEVLVLLRELAALPGQGVRRVMLTLNQPEPVLAALRQQDQAPSSFPFQLVLIENTVPLGFGANHNRAFARDAAMGPSDAFAVFNPDLHLHGNPLAAMAQVLVEKPTVGAAYPRQLDSAGAPSDSERLLPTPARLLARYLGARKHEVPAGGEPDWVNAACLLVRREAYEQISGFDERYHMYCEDVDFCIRLRLAGWGLERAQDAVVEHVAQRASHRKLRHLVWHVTSLCKLWGSKAYRDWTKSKAK
ncbi:glycosyltransferase [Ottowia thiooxydans]|uniref:glycosyltransferase n=1 Tax=Ottowia thiooxydans TaxID=219182 RepID=UPI00146D5929|nr:glycosyltransferase family 2 protein [Ottowia thiooxydans]